MIAVKFNFNIQMKETGVLRSVLRPHINYLLNKMAMIAVFIFSTVNVLAQNAKEDIKAINAFYQKHKKISMEVKYIVYPSHMSVAAYETTEGSVKKDGNNFFQKMGEVVTMRNTKYQIAVDPYNQHIIVGTAPSGSAAPLAAADLDSLIKYALNVTVMPLQNNVRRMTFSFPDANEFEKVEIFYSTETFFVQKMLLFFSQEISMDDEGKQPEQKPRMEIRYSNLNTNPVFEANLFSEKNYFDLKGTKLVATGKYNNYQLFDQRLKQK